MPVQEPLVREKESPGYEACQALLLRVLGSPQLRRAARMREFLQFVGQRTLIEGSGQIHEQEIGSEVFGRPPGYDTSVDNIVRVNATDLRKRVEEYFATDGAHETLVFEIPRGSYKPVFRQRIVEPDPPKPPRVIAEPEFAKTPVARPLAKVNHALLSAAGFLILGLAIACAVLWSQRKSLLRPRYAVASTPVLASFWAPFFATRQNTDILLADTSFALIEDITRQPIPLDSYLNRKYMSQIQSPTLSEDRREDLSLIAQRNTGSLGDFRVAQLISQLDPLAKNVRLYYARDYTPPLIKQDSVIIVGSRKSNPWADLFSSRLNFTVEYNPATQISYIRNRKAAAGEQEIYTVPPASPDPTDGYSVVAYLPNPEQNGKVLLIAGTGSEATEGAGEFLTSELSLASFAQQMHVKTLPYFEVLLRTTHLNSTPMSASIVAYRTYPSN